ncbi:efflux RND transporter permease subunit [Ruegeria sp. 2012CJ41-6]|uniref:Efflux RND transporter permease subunit n=1 Tax=Ruegeria spongiae TaxID=2942209 RepID=A0ABT0Q5H8_9RHOB|nr:efflux RND transporter permease subunit [Ruegeria spongiae]MCL6285126.1 efflux RND transporter permease subunit [Ruegeria spongiae]
MQIARFSINNPIATWIVILTCLFGGIVGFFSLGRLEDPAFTIKTATVVTLYPGATADEVAREVTENIESEVQKMSEVDKITSVNTPGLSVVKVDIKKHFPSSALPAVWTKLRARVDDATPFLPDGANPPYVNDRYGDVFGIYFAVTAPDFTDRERHELATFIRRELLAVKGVADVALSGLPEEAIYVQPDLDLTANLGVPPAVIGQNIATANALADAGRANGIRINRPDGSNTVEEIQNLTIGVNGELVRLADVASVERSRVADPTLIIRQDGVEAFTVGVAGIQTENIVEVGYRVDQRLAELRSSIPAGVELSPIYQQHLIVDEASNAFLINLAMSVVIVIVVLALAMGWRAAIVVGTTLLLTVTGTILMMSIFSIEMERISLGALIIAMGMLVDNAIVIAEGMQTDMARGKSSRDAAANSADKTQIPLLGATVIGIMAFAGIGLSPDDTGEFLFSLFAVIGLSLMLSWILAITVTPLLGHYCFKIGSGGESDAYDAPMFRIFASVLGAAIRVRWLVIVSLVALTAVCFAAFGSVKQQFFPYSNTPLFFIHYKLAQGTKIQKTSEDMKRIEAWLAEQDEVVNMTTFVGDGASRFMLTYPTEDPNISYGQIIVRVDNVENIAPLSARAEAFGRENLPEGEFRTKRLLFGPGSGSPIQLRISGPDPTELRRLSKEAMAVLTQTSDKLTTLRTDWREREAAIIPLFSEDRARTAGITRSDMAEVLLFATEGITSGVFRDGDRLLPIYVRVDPDDPSVLLDQLIYSDTADQFVPLAQVSDGFDFEMQDTLYHRRNRLPTITVSGDVSPDVTPAEVQSTIMDAVEAIPLPLGYSMEWGGEYEDSANANENLARQLPLSLLVMVLISIFLFNALRQPLIIWLLVPMSVNGVVIGLLVTGMPFSFTALLGLLSLSGMLIKNGIVLVEEIDHVRETGKPLQEAIVEASVSRMRPVMLAAATTILGMLPLLTDEFFQSMAVTIMGGLAFASILTLIAAPVFYYVLFSRDAKREEAVAEPA